MTNTTQNYNGWSNYETWNVKLWIDNDQGTQEYWNEQAKECEDAISLADRLKDYYDNNMHELGVPELTGFYADLLNAALSEVNWHEIAVSMIEEIAETGKES